ncbi:MAG TPA: 50S ribosomal protein L37ae [Candidatus Nanoarchaeia archaeon]|nr:50S ribosomal protein L37ae [Candidatus Nanoarchaeia archaeon]
MARTKKVKATGKYGAGYGTNVRIKLASVELKQRKKQTCPFCKKPGVKRRSAGIWNCTKCGKVFANNAYYLVNK